MFHGVPFNIASSALLLTIIGKLTNRTPGILTMNMGDCHIYAQHSSAVREQLSRFKYRLARVEINRSFEKVEELSYEDFKLLNYECQPPIKADMVV